VSVIVAVTLTPLWNEAPASTAAEARIVRAGLAAVVVFSLLAAGAVLLTVGLATPSAVPWVAGLVALVGSVLVDHGRARALPRTSRSAADATTSSS